MRMKEVKNANGSATRARIALTYKWGGKSYPNIETSLAERGKMKFKLLVGRNLIKELKLPVHISDQEVND